MTNFTLKDGRICVSDDIVLNNQEAIKDMIAFLEQNPDKMDEIESTLDNLARTAEMASPDLIHPDVIKALKG